MGEQPHAAVSKDIVAAFQAEGYRALFTGDLPSTLPAPRVEERRIQPSTVANKPGRSPASAPPIRQEAPSVPLIVDGSSTSSDALREFDGRPLFYAVEPEGEHDSILHAFTREDDATSFILSVAESSPLTGSDPNGFFGSHVQPAYPAYFFEHAGCQGGRISLDYRHAFWDLTQVWLGGILWWWTSWNDQISSLITTGRGVKLYEHINWGGSWIYFGRSTMVWDLSVYGWNDRVSSIETTF